MIKLLRLFVIIAVLSSAWSDASAQINISVRIAPPALPVYVQPACPYDGYLWQPGYWAYNQDIEDYYWVPGVWVSPPRHGLYWTPPYWGYAGNMYGFHSGYWSPHVGFYGGINYGYGYGGIGFGGGEWYGDGFRYNTAVVNVNRTVVHNTYIDRTVINNITVNNHTSYNGVGGVTRRPTRQEQVAMRELHVRPTYNQISHEQNARADRSQFSKVNNGRPIAAAMNPVNGNAFGTRDHAVSSTSEGRQLVLEARGNNRRNIGGNTQYQQNQERSNRRNGYQSTQYAGRANRLENYQENQRPAQQRFEQQAQNQRQNQYHQQYQQGRQVRQQEYRQERQQEYRSNRRQEKYDR